MKRVLVLGSGLVSRPGVSYLLRQNNLTVTVASLLIEEARDLVRGHQNGTAVQVNVVDIDAVDRLIRDHDIVVSLLPWIYHVRIAFCCLKNSRPMLTTSYVSDEMKQLDGPARDRGVLFLNEIGLDPGLDHMSAKKIIDSVHAEGGKIHHFYSFCGGLPAPEDNDNPLGYKFSWSPRGVLMAANSPAKYLENGEVVNLCGTEVFSRYRMETIDGLGPFEVYANRNSLKYRDLYGLTDARTIMRGTYRNVGWCDTIKKILDLGLIDDTTRSDLGGLTYREMMRRIVKAGKGEDVVEKTAERIAEKRDSEIMRKLTWLGLFSDDPLPDRDNFLDVMSERFRERLKYEPGQRDMIILRHRFIVENSSGEMEEISSTLIDFGSSDGQTSMARTVSLPLGIAVKLVAENRFRARGVVIPTTGEIYQPVLEELAELGICMDEKKTRLE